MRQAAIYHVNALANPEHLAILRQGVAKWNDWRRTSLGAPEYSDLELERILTSRSSGQSKEERSRWLTQYYETIEAAKRMTLDLSEADLSHVDLVQANLSFTDLRGADLREATLSGANLANSTLVGANLSRADMIRASLRNANLLLANLADANLVGADLSDAKLIKATLMGACLSGANLYKADLRGAACVGADLTGTLFLLTNIEGADLTGARVYGMSVWNIKLDSGTIQRDLIITPQNDLDSIVTVDDLEVAQFIYLLLRNDRVRKVIDTMTSKVVLILGRFTPQRKVVLDAVREELRKRDYLPVVFDFEKPSNRDLTETVSTLAHMAKFIIADLTDAKSIPQ